MFWVWLLIEEVSIFQGTSARFLSKVFETLTKSYIYVSFSETSVSVYHHIEFLAEFAHFENLIIIKNIWFS